MTSFELALGNSLSCICARDVYGDFVCPYCGSMEIDGVNMHSLAPRVTVGLDPLSLDLILDNYARWARAIAGLTQKEWHELFPNAYPWQYN